MRVVSAKKVYPIDERLWLLSTAYNTGVECLQFVISLVSGLADVERGPCSASLTDEAKRWFECSTVLCRFVPDGRLRAEKVCATTTEYSSHRSGHLGSFPDIQSLHRVTDALHRPTQYFSRLTAPSPFYHCVTHCISLLSVVLFLYFLSLQCKFSCDNHCSPKSLSWYNNTRPRLFPMTRYSLPVEKSIAVT